jgi:hypothetical protein
MTEVAAHIQAEAHRVASAPDFEAEKYVRGLIS